MGDGNERTGAEHRDDDLMRTIFDICRTGAESLATPAVRRAATKRPDEGLFHPETNYSVYYEVERIDEEIHLNVLSTDTGRRVGYVTMDVIAAERVALAMIEAVRQVERILEAQAGAA